MDWPAYTFYEELLQRHPDAKVLLSVRDPERWYESTRDTIYQLSKITAGFRLSRAIFAFVGLFVPGVFGIGRIGRMGNEIISEGTFGGHFEDRSHAIEVFERHNEGVERRVPAEKLLVFEVREGWGASVRVPRRRGAGQTLPSPQRRDRDAAQDAGGPGALPRRARRPGAPGRGGPRAYQETRRRVI